MTKSAAGSMSKFVLAALLATGAAGSAIAQEKNSGFLREYDRLQETKDGAGKTVRSWVSPKLTPANYHAIMLDPLIFHPEPRPSEKVDAKVLQQMLKYANDTLRQSMGKRFEVVDRPGPGVLRLRAAFSSVAAEGEGLKPYQYVPFAFVATMASRAATGTPQRAAIIVEVEGTDATSGELLALRVKAGTGERLKEAAKKSEDQTVITLDNVKPLLDEMAAGALPDLGKFVKAKSK